MRGFIHAAGGALVLAVAGCGGLRVDSDYDQLASFAELRSYDWLDTNGQREDALAAIDPFLARRVRRAVDEELEQRGFVRVDERRPDFHVAASVVTSGAWTRGRAPYRRARPMCAGPNVSVFFGFGYPYGFGFGPPFYRFPFPYFGYPRAFTCAYRLGFGYIWVPVYRRRDEYGPGTLIIDVVERESRELIWRGWADGALLDAPRREELPKYLAQVVAKILEDFPPR